MNRYRETQSLIDQYNLRGEQAIFISAQQADEALSAASMLESGDGQTYVESCEKALHSMNNLENIYHSEKVRRTILTPGSCHTVMTFRIFEKARKEQRDRDREAEMSKLMPAIEILHGLTTKMEVIFSRPSWICSTGLNSMALLGPGHDFA